MTYKVYVEDGKVIVNYDLFPATHPNKYRSHEVGTLSVSLSSDNKITVTKPDGTFLYKDVLYTNFRVGIDNTLPSSGLNAKQELEKIFAGQESRKYVLDSSQSSVSFSGDVEYLTFPSSPYGVIRNMLVSESVCIGDSEDSVRGTQNSLELRNLSYICIMPKVKKKGVMPKMKIWVHKSRSGGLTAKGVAAYRRANPGSKLKTAVTTPPSKLKKGSKAAKRRKSFCARMSGMKGPMKKPNGKPTRKALALRKWNC